MELNNSAVALGEDYLISATNGDVNYCGFSGEVTPELRAGYEAASASARARCQSAAEDPMRRSPTCRHP